MWKQNPASEAWLKVNEHWDVYHLSTGDSDFAISLIRSVSNTNPPSSPVAMAKIIDIFGGSIQCGALKRYKLVYKPHEYI